MIIPHWTGGSSREHTTPAEWLALLLARLTPDMSFRERAEWLLARGVFVQQGLDDLICPHGQPTLCVDCANDRLDSVDAVDGRRTVPHNRRVSDQAQIPGGKGSAGHE